MLSFRWCHITSTLDRLTLLWVAEETDLFQFPELSKNMLIDAVIVSASHIYNW